MIKKIIVSIFAILLLVSIAVLPVHAELSMPQVFSWEDDIARDFNGNPITDCWAYDPSQESGRYVLLDSQGKMIEQKDSFEIEEEPSATGWIEITVTLPEELQGKDILVSITGPKNYSFTLYSVNNYRVMKEVNVGTYKVETAMISGDYTGEYLPTFPEEIVVYENSTAGALKIDFVNGFKVEATEKPETTEIQEETPVESHNPLGFLQILLISIFVLIIIAGVYIYKKLKENE